MNMKMLKLGVKEANEISIDPKSAANTTSIWPLLFKKSP